MEKEERLQRIKAGAFLASVAGISAVVGFSATLAAAKKTDPKFFSKVAECKRNSMKSVLHSSVAITSFFYMRDHHKYSVSQEKFYHIHLTSESCLDRLSLTGKTFNYEEQPDWQAVRNFFQSKPSTFYKEGIDKLPGKWEVIDNCGLQSTHDLADTGAMLALRALGWGTLYAIAGTGCLCYGIWKLSGAKDLKDFRIKMGNMLPVLPKNNPPQSRTEFSGLNDLLIYISEDYGKKK